MPERLQSIQCLRGVAACLVVGYHFVGMAAPGADAGPVIALFRRGWIGIDLFFVVSGFIIALTTEYASGPRDAADYLRRRIARIVPIYWCLTLAMAAISLSPLMPASDVSITPAWLALSLSFWPPKAWGYLSPILFVGWTLSYEMLFYAIVFVAVALRSRLLIAATILLLVAAGLVSGPGDNLSWAWITNSIIAEFLMGYAVFVIYRTNEMSLPRAAILFAAGLVAIAVAVTTVPDNTIWRSLANGLAVSIFILGLIGIERNVAVAVPAWMAALGDASYSIYLMQCFTLPLAAFLFPRIGVPLLGPTAVCIAGVVMTAVLGFAVYALLERPLMSGARRALGLNQPRPVPASS